MPDGSAVDSDDELLARHAAGDPDAFSELVRRHRDRLWAVALRTLEIYEEDDVLGQARARAPQFARRIAALAGHPLVGDARAIGLVGALELMADAKFRIPFKPELRVGTRVAQRALEQGVILRPLQDTLSFCPPLIIGAAEIDFLFDVVGRALDQVAAELACERQAAVA